MRKTLYLLLASLCMSVYARAQVPGYLNALNTTGVASTHNYTYSVGEVVAWSNHCSYTTGVVQPICLCTVVSVKEAFDEKYASKFYPNPTHSHIIVETDFAHFVNYSISSMDGKTLETGKFAYSPIELERLELGAYLLRLSDADNQIFKTVKIIKQ